MKCNRLEKQIKSWYVQVQDEAMAPARMVEFMEKHIRECEVCLADEGVRRDINRITEIVLPPAKVRKKTLSRDDDSSEGDAVDGDESVDTGEVDDSPSDDTGDDEYDDDELDIPDPEFDD